MNKFFNTLIQENPEHFVMIFSILFWKYLSCLFSVLGQKWSRRFRGFLSDIEILLFPLIFQFCNRK